MARDFEMQHLLDAPTQASTVEEAEGAEGPHVEDLLRGRRTILNDLVGTVMTEVMQYGSLEAEGGVHTLLPSQVLVLGSNRQPSRCHGARRTDPTAASWESTWGGILGSLVNLNHQKYTLS